MGRVDVFSIPGLECRFPSLDHDPPHVHVRRAGEWEIKVRILTTTRKRLHWEVKWPPDFTGPPRPLRRRLAKLVHQHCEELLEEWSRKVQRL